MVACLLSIMTVLACLTACMLTPPPQHAGGRGCSDHRGPGSGALPCALLLTPRGKTISQLLSICRKCGTVACSPLYRGCCAEQLLWLLLACSVPQLRVSLP